MAVQDDDEDDYMSDTFLKSESTEDIRPGLLITPKQQRLHNQMKKKKNTNY